MLGGSVRGATGSGMRCGCVYVHVSVCVCWGVKAGVANGVEQARLVKFQRVYESRGSRGKAPPLVLFKRGKKERGESGDEEEARKHRSCKMHKLHLKII